MNWWSVIGRLGPGNDEFIVRRQAEDDIDEIAALIAKDNLTAALRFYDRGEETFDRIAAWPMVGTAER